MGDLFCWQAAQHSAPAILGRAKKHFSVGYPHINQFIYIHALDNWEPCKGPYLLAGSTTIRASHSGEAEENFPVGNPHTNPFIYIHLHGPHQRRHSQLVDRT
jgi:hypothetical protein